MNKAFVREPEFDGKAFCPRCGSLGVEVGQAVLDRHLRDEARGRLGNSAWFCGFAQCEVAYFDLFERLATVEQLRCEVFPKSPSAPICACFCFTLDDLDEDLREGAPTRVRALLARSKTSEARCRELAADGQCCMREVQRLYVRGVGAGDKVGE